MDTDVCAFSQGVTDLRFTAKGDSVQTKDMHLLVIKQIQNVRVFFVEMLAEKKQNAKWLVI